MNEEHTLLLKSITEALVHLLLINEESLTLILELWISRRDDAFESTFEKLYSLMRTIAFSNIDLNIELFVSETPTYMNQQPLVSGYLSLFTNINYKIPLKLLCADQLTCVMALCAQSVHAFEEKKIQKVTQKVKYVKFKYNETFQQYIPRFKIIDKLVDVMISKNDRPFHATKDILVLVFDSFKNEEYNAMRESYKRLLNYHDYMVQMNHNRLVGRRNSVL